MLMEMNCLQREIKNNAKNFDNFEEIDKSAENVSRRDGREYFNFRIFFIISGGGYSLQPFEDH